jgi:hypothetical protein
LSKPLVGLSEDRKKCFDCFDSRTTIPIAEALGLPLNISKPLLNYYAQHRRRFIINQQAGPLFETFRLVQGDAWSTRLVNATFSILAKRAETVCPHVQTQFFVDDSKTRCPLEFMPELKQYQLESARFNRLTGQIINNRKTVAWGTDSTSRLAAKSILPTGGSLLLNCKFLGFSVATTRKRSVRVLNGRIQNATATVIKVATLPHTGQKRAMFCSSCAIPKLTYGGAVIQPTPKALGHLINTILKAVWSKDQIQRISELVFLQVFKSHVIHPELANYYTALNTIRTFLIMHPSERNLFH